MNERVQSIAVSVIIPVWNDPDRLRICLEALERQTLDKDRFEVIVVDNGSTDHTPDVARGFAGVTVLCEPKVGSYAARNTGLKHARGALIAFTDADCIPEPEWLEAGLRMFSSNPDIGQIAGHVHLFSSGNDISRACMNYQQVFTLNQESDMRRTGSVSTANWMSPKQVFTTLGGFNESLKSGGDFEMSMRIRSAGYRQEFCADAVVRHPARGSVAEVVVRHKRTKGGIWDRSTLSLKPIRLPMIETRWMLGQLRRVARLEDKSIAERAELAGFLGLLWAHTIIEFIRLSLGGASRRA